MKGENRAECRIVKIKLTESIKWTIVRIKKWIHYHISKIKDEIKASPSKGGFL